MPRSLTQFLIFPALMLLLAACGTPTPSAETKQSYFDAVAGVGEAHFRGINIGATDQDIATAETGQPIMAEAETYMVYEYPLTGKDFYSVTYDLNANELYAIQVLVELESPEMATDLFEKFRGLFTERYGVPTEADDFHASWLFFSDASEEIEVTLDNESLNSDHPQLSIRFYDFDY